LSEAADLASAPRFDLLHQKPAPTNKPPGGLAAGQVSAGITPVLQPVAIAGLAATAALARYSNLDLPLVFAERWKAKALIYLQHRKAS
jgi:hypothetical protein